MEPDDPPDDDTVPQLEVEVDDLPPLRRSEFAAELARLSPSILSRYGVSTPVLVILDGVVAFCHAVMDEQDHRGLIDKLEDAATRAMEGHDLTDGAVQGFLADVAEADVKAYAEKLVPKDNFREFFKRLVGAAAYHRLTVALTADSAPVVSVARMAVSHVAPYAAAWDDLTAELSLDQLKAFKDIAQSRGQVLPLMASVFRALDSTVVHLHIPESWMSRASLPSMGEDEIDRLRAEFRTLTAGRSRAAMQELSATLSRKLSGAKDALAHSADSVSQAANSLIELIDRLLRVFTDQEVIEWVEANYPDLPETTHVDPRTGRRRPTKRGQALCLVHACRRVESGADLYIVAAMALKRTRDTLQQLKHADEGTAEEQEQVESCMQEVESFLFLLTGFTWVTANDDVLDMIRTRLDPKRARRELVAESA